MTKQTTHHHLSKSNCSQRSHHHHRHRHHHHEARHYSDDDGSSESSDTTNWSAEEPSQDQTVPRISAWSEPFLDAHSNGQFQYQARITPGGYQWTLSGSDSGTNPQYLSPYPNSHIGYSAAVTYPAGVQQSQPQYYEPSNAAVPLTGEGSRDHRSEEYYEEGEEKPRRDRGVARRSKKISSDHRDKGRDDHHRSHSHSHHHSHRHRHYRSKSHEDSNRRRHTDRGHDHAGSKEKVSKWLYTPEYID
ncbi:hypothetical protein HD806DRAFT_459360 [Xylariaceae sp. AK1471]|nr:hypothetical protein HD806DRAFT_459360 [Xylariaceae sp. AK1471]